MTATLIRRELHDMFDAIPDQSLPAIKPLLAYLSADYWKPILETDLSPEEVALIDAGRAEYAKDPASFIPLEELR